MTQQQRGLSPQDFALMRAIVTWRRRTGAGSRRIEFSTNRAWGGFLTWKHVWPVPRDDRREVSVEVAFPGDEGMSMQLRMGVNALGAEGPTSMTYLEPASLTQAVDILVAIGFLPPRFSSAYQAGWDIGREDMEHPVPSGPEFAAILPAVWR